MHHRSDPHSGSHRVSQHPTDNQQRRQHQPAEYDADGRRLLSKFLDLVASGFVLLRPLSLKGYASRSAASRIRRVTKLSRTIRRRRERDAIWIIDAVVIQTIANRTFAAWD